MIAGRPPADIDTPKEAVAQEPSVLKYVYCSYRGYLIVYDVYAKKVRELSGLMSYEKYMEIEKRSLPEITVFEGLNFYRCLACELKEKESEK